MNEMLWLTSEPVTSQSKWILSVGWVIKQTFACTWNITTSCDDNTQYISISFFQFFSCFFFRVWMGLHVNPRRTPRPLAISHYSIPHLSDHLEKMYFNCSNWIACVCLSKDSWKLNKEWLWFCSSLCFEAVCQRNVGKTSLSSLKSLLQSFDRKHIKEVVYFWLYTIDVFSSAFWSSSVCLHSTLISFPTALLQTTIKHQHTFMVLLKR